MRKVLLILLINLPVLATGQTSKYHPFPDSNAVWNFYHNLGCITGQAEEKYSIVFAGDTTIKSKVYHKLKRPYVKFSSLGGCGRASWSGDIGSIRQDINEKKVFFVPHFDSAEHLLYDFNMDIGDTVKGQIAKFTIKTGYPDTVYAIDSVLVGNSYRKRWWFNQCYEVYLIEGVGCNLGLITLSPGCATDADYFEMTCFKQNGLTLYPNTASECRTITSISSAENSRPVKIYPNPSGTGTFTINLDNNSHIKELRVVDLLGKTVLLNQAPENNQLQIRLKRGTYILQVIGEGNKVSREVLVAL